MKKTALIGASGFVGSAILKELLSRGYEVEALVRKPENVKINAPPSNSKKGRCDRYRRSCRGS